MKKFFLLAGIVAILLGLGIYYFAKNESPPKISCEQNSGPFNNVLDPQITKTEAREQLTRYYESCLKPQYEQGFINDPKQGNSETQSYALLQSYFAGDKKTFHKVLTWTNQNIKRPGDDLFAWKFEVTADEAKILDENSATDADTDIAYALFKAGTDWGYEAYVEQAKKIIDDIWNIETAEINGQRYVLAGPWANHDSTLVVNPSYLSPHAYRTFGHFDSSHDWNKLATDSYDLLEKVSNRNRQNFVIPPNWILVSKTDESLNTYADKPDSLDYSYDGFRTFWRVALDQLKNPNAQSWNYISSVNQFENDWKSKQEVCSLYLYRNQNYVCDKSTTSTLAGPIAVFSVTNGFLSAQVIQKYYIKDNEIRFPDTEFYGSSWDWFAVWLWANS